MPLDARRIEKALHFLADRAADAEAKAPPTLAETAAHVGLSEAHFQRMFSRWAGLSPKKFLMQLTVERAKSLLLERRSVLEAALQAGLSGPSRLHDHFVAIEAMTPGEFGRGGAGLRIVWGEGATPFGRGLAATTPRGLCALSFLGADDAEAEAERAAILGQWPRAELVRDDRRAQQLIDKIVRHIAAGRSGTPLALHLRGTNFQLQVWRALLLIPPGRLTCYSDLAAAIGRPKASRAVGQAVGANPVAMLIPCHRVIRSLGAIGHYAGGVHRKRALLAWETAPSEEQARFL